MSFRTEYPDYAAIEQHIRRARAERAVVIAHLFADAIMFVTNGLRALVGVRAPQRNPKGALLVKASVTGTTARA